MRFVPSNLTEEEDPRIPTVRRVSFPRIPAPGGQPGSQSYRHSSQAFTASAASMSLKDEPAVWLHEDYQATELPRGGQGAAKAPCSIHLPFYKQSWFWPVVAFGVVVGLVVSPRS